MVHHHVAEQIKKSHARAAFSSLSRKLATSNQQTLHFGHQHPSSPKHFLKCPTGGRFLMTKVHSNPFFPQRSHGGPPCINSTFCCNWCNFGLRYRISSD